MQDYCLYVTDRERRRRALYNVLVAWPGVASIKTRRFIKRNKLEATRAFPL